jgi:hypothetical protein
MSISPSSGQPIRSLSVGNVVSAGLRIYRDRFRLYYGLAFIGYLWSLVPIYGWAKFSATTGLLSRLAYREIVERPETVQEARRHVNSRMWSFLGAGILVSLVFFGVSFVALFLLILVFAVLGTVLGQNTGAIVIVAVLALIALIAFIIGYVWLICRLFVVEVPLAIESNMDAASTISRSWQLTQGFVSRLQWIVVIAFLITIPIVGAVQLVNLVIQGLLANSIPQGDSLLFSLLYFLLILPLSLASNALLLPFWQAIKAVIYYDIRSRREGLGLQVRDSRPQ